MSIVNLKNVTEGKWTVEETIELLNEGKIDVDIAIQRSERWKQNQKEGLIDSILEGYPRIPQIQLNNVTKDNVYEAIDGKQRLTSLRDILNDRFVVTRDEPFFYKGEQYVLKGKRYSEFPEGIKRQIAMYPLNFIIYTNLSETEKRVCFYRTNMGTPLSKTEHYRAVCKSLPEINEIADHAIFANYSNTVREEIVVKTKIMLGDNPHIGNDKDTYLMWSTITFPEKEKEELLTLYDKTLQVCNAYSKYAENRVEHLCEKEGIEQKKQKSKINTYKKKIHKKTHILTLLPLVAKNMTYDSNLFGLWLARFFIDSLDTTSESELYNENSTAGSGNTIQTKNRMKAMEDSLEKFKLNPLFLNSPTLTLLEIKNFLSDSLEIKKSENTEEAAKANKVDKAENSESVKADKVEKPEPEKVNKTEKLKPELEPKKEEKKEPEKKLNTKKAEATKTKTNTITKTAKSKAKTSDTSNSESKSNEVGGEKK